MNWAAGIRASIVRASREESDEDQARLTLESLPEAVYAARRAKKPHLTICKVDTEMSWDALPDGGDKVITLNTLRGANKIVCTQLQNNGFHPFIHIDGRKTNDCYTYDYYLCLPVRSA